jgi:hypothetical protein
MQGSTNLCMAAGNIAADMQSVCTERRVGLCSWHLAVVSFWCCCDVAIVAISGGVRYPSLQSPLIL